MKQLTISLASIAQHDLLNSHDRYQNFGVNLFWRPLIERDCMFPKQLLCNLEILLTQWR